ncbi:hypothetical protein Ait01nite_038790 [Actinoplanes italicus]|uniref:Uncharacterized protein n=1 Tax=Actinoplanes italicus TaxID=113567 RepID=A0A2T0K2Z2_9ACTN|nr:hypothetical protein [Actinoplanes italicus]PRX17174.1 hypothetical protein CLV67_117231 [Actinoplanes italicus]GIE30834.1 hypothetical protein Ait01nite_038790 [Actinoplanes italicus]
MATYIRWYYAEEDLWCYDELDEDRHSVRHVERRDRDGAFFAAASLAEVVHARDTGGFEAVVAYERAYGVSPEQPFDYFAPDDAVECRFGPIAEQDFERIWRKARQARRRNGGPHPR